MQQLLLQTLRLLAIAGASLLSGLICTLYQQSYQRGAGDLTWLLDTARLWLAGGDPYALPLMDLQIAYPFPATLAVLPLTPLPDRLAAGVFVALATAVLLSGGLRVSPWAWLILLSFPYWRAVQVVNLTLLVAAAYYLPWLACITPAKPNTGLPVALTSRIALLSAAVMGLISLLLYPAWPFIWLHKAQLDVYVGRPLLFEPLGFLALLLLPFAYGSRDARYLLLVCLVPLRDVYDPILLLLVARQPWEWLLLVGMPWVVVLIDHNISPVPLAYTGTLVWFLMGLPAIAIVILRIIRT